MQIETPAEFDMYPGGAGLTLMPSGLWTGRAMVTRHPDGSAVVVGRHMDHAGQACVDLLQEPTSRVRRCWHAGDAEHQRVRLVHHGRRGETRLPRPEERVGLEMMLVVLGNSSVEDARVDEDHTSMS